MRLLDADLIRQLDIWTRSACFLNARQMNTTFQMMPEKKEVL